MRISQNGSRAVALWFAFHHLAVDVRLLAAGPCRFTIGPFVGALQAFALALSSRSLTFVCELFAFVRELLAIIGNPVALVGHAIPAAEQELTSFDLGLAALEGCLAIV